MAVRLLGTDSIAPDLPDVVTASVAETIAGIVTDRAVTPASLYSQGDIDPRRYGFSTAATGVVNSTALQSAIDEACGVGDPVAVARVANRRVVLPAGVYLLNTQINIRSVIGLVIEGMGNCDLRANAAMTSVFDINGMAYSRIGGFTITGTSGVQVDNVIYTYWDNATAAFNNSGNSYHDIVIRDLDYITAFRVGKPASTLATDNNEYRNIDLHGTWTTGNTTRYQAGLLLGTGAGANNLVHHVYKFRGWNIRYPLKIETTQVAVYGAGIAGCDTAIWCQPFYYASFHDFDIETAERFMFTPGSGFNSNVSASDISFRASGMNADGKWIDFNSAGTLAISQIFVAEATVTPLVDTGPAPIRIEATGLAVQATTDPDPADCFVLSTQAVARVRGFARVNGAGATTSIEDWNSDGGGLALAADHAFSNHIVNSTGTEPGAVVCWTADDGYTKQVDYFALLDSKGIKGTLFVTKNWVGLGGTNATWGDTYITQAQVQAISNNGHELASHGVAHEDVNAYLVANGEAALEAMEQTSIDYIESTFGVTVNTGAYPAGQSNERTREIVARNHRFFRGTKGVTVLGAPDPFDIPAIDVQNLTEAAIKAHVDTAVGNRNLVVFLVHGGMTAGNLTTYGNVMTYITSLGVPQKRFDEAVMERTSWRGSAGAMIDTQGNARFTDARATRFEVHRADATAGKAWWDLDETSGLSTFQTDGPNFAFATNTEFAAGFQGGRRRSVADGATTNTSTTVTSGVASFDQRDVGITISGTGIPGGSTITAVTNATTVTISAAATATATGVTLTLGRPVGGPVYYNDDATYYSNFYLNGLVPSITFRANEATETGRLTAALWQRAGVGGGMTIDSGTGGSFIEHKGYGHRFWNHAGERKVHIATGALPADGSVATGELVIFFDATPGAAKVTFKGKNSSGTVVTGNVALV